MPISDREALLDALRAGAGRDDAARLAPFEYLTPREQAVLGDLMDGHVAQEIASRSFVSVATVRSQIRAVLAKLSVHSQGGAVALAHRAGWRPSSRA